MLDRIPAMAQVTVREVYSGSSYQLTVPGDRRQRPLPSGPPEQGLQDKTFFSSSYLHLLFQSLVNLQIYSQWLDRYGSLEIVKTLSEYETMGGVQESATFVFEVTGMLDDQVVYSNVEIIPVPRQPTNLLSVSCRRLALVPGGFLCRAGIPVPRPSLLIVYKPRAGPRAATGTIITEI